MPRGKKAATKNKKKNAKSRKVAIVTLTENIADIAEANNDSDEECDEYFKSEHYLKKGKLTSKAKFTEIDCLSSMDIVPLKRKAMQQTANKALKERSLYTLRTEKYQRWLTELKSGFNLLFYGVGSKKFVLDDFGKSYCSHDPHGVVIRVNGYLEELTLKQIMDGLHNVIIDVDKKKKSKKNCIASSSKDVTHRAVNMVQYLEENIAELQYRYYYLIVHNICGHVLRKSNVQRVFSILANCKYIHLIASMDHIHSLLLWDREKLSLFHWIYHELTTYRHYFEEMEFERDMTIQLTNNSTNHGLKHIMCSFTPQHRDIIQLLAQAQCDEGVEGLSRTEWYEKCEENLLCHSTTQFDNYIAEFIDHNVIELDTSRGDTIYIIPFNKQVIRKYLIEYDLENDE
mmetsp:Transcript_28710/g.47070  ORF Transcript_28710/g.47070 Transcript_28710/m.47070 type:complete len:400 (-) Transcript_28710:69-1268(-)|eukprot:CAMPEP_0202701268 /NCGR_PEP_ID=MMETSP1385-20130828/14365_1 /ASSEMBLY_ACC=CAM_ASM_000861 /TAXON_ID=933848 /ORGANISM="Elphidium margaritaceum" /LENGTH=399 /DNA_ID=CAMNT_0049358647 /DNA_START=36 /DNA_END=1235 /DNA_ORIENTATION=-